MSNTPSFVLELKLNTNVHDEQYLARRFELAWRMHNKLVTLAEKRIRKLRQDPEYRRLLEQYIYNKEHKLPVGEISKQLTQLRKDYGLTEYALHHDASIMKHNINNLLHTHVCQKIATAVWDGVEDVLFDNGKHLHHKRFMDFTNLECKTNSGLIYRKNGVLEINKRKIQVQLDKSDAYEVEALKHRLKYCRLVRRPMGTKWHYYVQLVLEGEPPLTIDKLGIGKCGLDIGTSTLASVDDEKARLCVIGEGVDNIEREVRRNNRRLDRSRRAMNPDNYNPDGTVRKGRKTWHNSHNYYKTRFRNATLQAKRALSLKQEQCKLAKQLLAEADTFYVEKMNFKGLQKKAKSDKDKPKKKRKRFGKSIQNRAPAQLIRILKQKAERVCAKVCEVNTVTFKASQYNHVDDTYVKKKLNKRSTVVDGHKIQRDLYSAFLLMNSDDSLECCDRDRCMSSFEKFVELHDACINEMLSSDKKYPSSFGLKDFM